MSLIYLDYNATTPVDPAVTETMLPYLKEGFGNPSSAHALGKQAHDAVDRARGQVAALLGARADEVIFTGGGTEASNHAIKGAYFVRLTRGITGIVRRWIGGGRFHMIISAFEHPATAQPAEFLRRLG